MNGTKDCGGRICSFAYSNESLSCQNGTGDCFAAYMLEAEPSEFHDQYLVEATKKIQEILRSIPEDRKGRKLSFLHTKMGLFLAWVSVEEGDSPKDAITVDSDNETLAKALRLTNYPAAEAKAV